MKKKKTVQKPKEDKPVTLGDMLNEDIMKQLKEQKQQLQAKEEREKAEQEQKKKEERRLKEKNKSFEELLAENPLDWRKFK
jgi:uncharacterized membrane protein YgaE (UPF0421/DUF939 family)